MQKEIRQNRTERMRAYIIYLIYKSRPRPIELSQLQRLLDARNFPVSRHRLAEELCYLRDAGALLVESIAAGSPASGIDWIERYADSDDDMELGDRLRARLTPLGVLFQEGSRPIDGIARVE